MRLAEYEQVVLQALEESRTALDAYAAAHGLDRAAVLRLALMGQLKKPPPKKLPEGVVRDSSTPDPAAAGRKGAAARWKGHKKGKR